jgi:diadenosine tetraphosphate (Ap4A) HIT family hydrolase
MQCSFCDASEDFSMFGIVIHEDDRAAVVLHSDSAVAGHAMVIWKRHVENVSDLDRDELARLYEVHHAAERVLLAETGRDRAILLKLGLQTPHLHLHVYPIAASATRADVMAAINAGVREDRPSDFAERCARSLTAILA